MAKLPSQQQNESGARKFGFTMAAILVLLGAYLFWKGASIRWFVGGAGVTFFVLAVLVPVALIPVERVWLKIGETIGSVVSLLILSTVYCLVFVPWGLILRVFGKDLLSLRLERSSESYWIPVETDGPCSRPLTPY